MQTKGIRLKKNYNQKNGRNKEGKKKLGMTTDKKI